MSMHRSLKTQPAALNQHRNVLTRTERIGRLTESEKFDPLSRSPLGLAKVANRQVVTKKEKKEAAEGAEGVAGAAPGAPATAAAGAEAKAGAAKPGAAGAKEAKPAAGAKAGGGAKPGGKK